MVSVWRKKCSDQLIETLIVQKTETMVNIYRFLVDTTNSQWVVEIYIREPKTNGTRYKIACKIALPQLSSRDLLISSINRDPEIYVTTAT